MTWVGLAPILVIASRVISIVATATLISSALVFMASFCRSTSAAFSFSISAWRAAALFSFPLVLLALTQLDPLAMTAARAFGLS